MTDPTIRGNREACEWCGGEANPSTTCPRSVDCPRCKGVAGGPCYSPSGHRRDELHAARVALAESSLTIAPALAGIPPAGPCECPRCGQQSTAVDVICDACRGREREPQGDALHLFTPAPAVIRGQGGLF